MFTVLFFLITLNAHALASEDTTVAMTGGWYSTNISGDDEALLTFALGGTSYASSVGDTRVCYAEVTSLEKQVVAGTNYRFHTIGCEVLSSTGACSKSTLLSCTTSDFVVEIFEQSWTDTLIVTSIKPE